MNTRIYRGSNLIKGFTLIELLSAMVLMSMVMVLATMSLAQFEQYTNKSGLGFEARINRYLGIERLGELLGRTVDYYVQDNLGKTRLYFNGQREKIQFVSNASWNDDAKGSLNILSVEERGDALLALVLYQKPLQEQVFFEFSQFPKQQDLQGKLIIDGASQITFDYLGIRNFRQLYPSGITENYRSNLSWSSKYEGAETGYLPDKVRINIVWPDGSEWPCIFDLKSQNFLKRGLMLGETS